MKLPLVLALVIGLILLSQIPLINTEPASAQSEFVFTLVSADGQPLAQVSDYTLTDNQLCFTVTNVSSCKTILGIGPDFAQGAIRATSISQTGPGVFLLSPDKKLTDVNGQFSVDVAFALLAQDSSSSLNNGINPGEVTHFCVTGDFRNLKAKNIAKNLLVIAGQAGACPPPESLSCGTVNANLNVSTCGDELCISVSNNSGQDACARFEFIGASFGGNPMVCIPAGQTMTSCGPFTSGGETATRMTVTFADGTTCSSVAEFHCTGGLSEVLGGRGQ